MGLDIYAGQLTRYYSRNWKTIAQQMDEDNGWKCTIVDSGNEIKTVEDEAEIKQINDAVCQWSDNLASAFEQPLATPLWSESCECGYYSDKPDWEAFGALIMLQAKHLLNHPFPEYVEGGWFPDLESIIEKATSEKIYCSLLSNVEIWLPIPDMCIFQATLPTGKEATFSTVSLLKQELDDLNQLLWKADEDTIISWRNDKYYNAVNKKQPKPILGFIPRPKHKEKFRTEELAQCAYSILYQAVSFASEHKVPIVLDY